MAPGGWELGPDAGRGGIGYEVHGEFGGPGGVAAGVEGAGAEGEEVGLDAWVDERRDKLLG